MSTSINRRTAVGAVLGAAGTGFLARAGLAQPATPAASPAAGLTWTDGRGVSLTFAEQPQRVVAMRYVAQSLYDFGYEVAGFFGGRPDGDEEAIKAEGDLDLDSIVDVSNVDSIDIEGVVDIDPDLVVDFSWGSGEEAEFWYLGGDALSQIQALAPVAGIATAGVSVDESIGQVESLARVLGADVDTPALIADREAYQASSAALTVATEANPGIKVLAFQTDGASVWIANPDYHADLIYYKQLGVSFTEIEVDAESAFWGTYSVEDFGTLSADLYLPIPFTDFSSIGIWEALPAVVAGQVGTWNFSRRLSHRGFTSNLDELAAAISAATIVAE